MLRTQQISYLFSEFFMPLHFFKIVQNLSFPEFLITNVPGYVKEIYIGSCKVKNITPITSLGNFKMFIAICSYCTKLNIVSSINKLSKFDLEKFNLLFSNIIENYV